MDLGQGRSIVLVVTLNTGKFWLSIILVGAGIIDRRMLWKLPVQVLVRELQRTVDTSEVTDASNTDTEAEDNPAQI